MDQTLNKLKALYSECFSDSNECTEYLFNNRLGAHNAYYERLNDKIICAMYLVSKKLVYGKNILDIPFIVGLSTAKQFRKQGYAQTLIKRVVSQTKAPFIMLYPAVKNFYEKMDFTVISYDDTLAPIYTKEKTHSAEQLLSIYKEKCKENDFYFQLNQNDFIDIINITKADGGNFYLLKDNGKIVGFTNLEQTLMLTESEKQNGVMARICNLDKAFQITKNDIPLKVRLTDSLLPQNNFCFTVKKGSIIKCKEFDITINIAELTAHFFGYKGQLKDYFKDCKGFIFERY